MNRRQACEAQVRLCLSRATTEISRRLFWHAEAIKWQHRADEETGKVMITYQISNGRIIASR